jgi:pimeloyl-ACP methyl ester carboxylesterase
LNVKTKHKLAAVGLIGTGFYLGACGLLYLMQRKLIYMAEKQAQGELPPEFKRWEDNGEFLGYKREQGRADALVFLHGSAHNAREWCWAVQHFPGDVYVVEFPGYGEKAETTTEFSLCEAGLRGFDSVPPHPGTTLLCGQSLGSAVAAAVLETREFKVQGVVLITPFTCLQAVAKWHYPMFPVVWLLKDRLAVLPAWEKFTGPAWALFAGKDEMIPVGTEEQFRKAARPGKHVRVFPGRRHSQILLRAEDWQQFLSPAPREELVRAGCQEAVA